MTHKSNMHVDCKSDSDDEKKEVYVAEFIWPSEAKPCSCSSLKPIPKNRQVQVCFTFDELLRSGNIKLSHTIPPLEELKRRAYCKWHNSSYATNDCNIFRQHIQSLVNEG